MKTKLKVIVALTMIMVVCLAFSGCFIADFNKVESISLVGTPKTLYSVNEAFDTSGFKIQVKYKSTQNPEIIPYDDTKFSNTFDSSVPGSYTCTIMHNSNANATLSFSYDVVEAGTFTEGTGTVASPYIVNTAEQFSHIGEIDGAYYKLGRDINFVEENVSAKHGARINGSGVYSVDSNGWNTMASSLSANSAAPSFKLGKMDVTGCVLNAFELDGNNYTVTFGGNKEESEVSLFNAVYNSTVKNMNVVFAPGSKALTVFNWVYGDLVCENITINGSVLYNEGQYNQGLLVYYDYYSKSITAKNIINNVSVNANYQYNGVFVGYSKNAYNYDEKTYTFTDCVNNGNMSGLAVGMVVGHTDGESGYTKENTTFRVNVTNFTNNGKITAAAYGMVGYDPTLLGFWGKREFKNGYISIYENNVVGVAENDSNINILGPLVSNGSQDATFVKNSNNEIVLSDAAKAKLAENNYTIKSRIYVSTKYTHSAGFDGSSYLSTNMSSDVNVAYPYVEVEQGQEKSAGQILTIKDGKIIAPLGTTGGYSFSGVGKQYTIAYMVYDANGNLVSSYKIAYKNFEG